MGDRLFDFPDPVNEVSARLVAAGVVVMSAAVAFGAQYWVLVPLAYGFVARVLTGPTLSPLGRLVTEVITPRLGAAAKHVPGPPKRFAQGIGAVLSVSAAVAYLSGSPGASRVLAGMIVGAAFLESAFGFCLGCKIFAGLMRIGVVPDSVCEACNDLSRRPVGVSAG